MVGRTRTDRLEVRIDATGDGRARAALANTEQGLSAVDRAAGAVRGRLNLLGAAIGALAVGQLAQLAGATVRAADQYNVLQGRLQQATRATGDYVQVSERLYAISQRNGAVLEDSVALFQNLARTAPELQATNEQMLTLTNLVQQLGVIGGSSSTALSAGLQQFSQAMAGGVLRAEEMNSIIENIPELANAIARGMGLTVGQLRLAVVEGGVLSRDVFDALLKQAPEIATAFERIPDSVERTQQSLANSLQRLAGELDRVVGLTDKLSGLGRLTAQGLDDISTRLGESELESLQRQRAQAAVDRQRILAGAIGGDPRTSPRFLDAERRIAELDEAIKAAQVQAASLLPGGSRSPPPPAVEAAAGGLPRLADRGSSADRDRSGGYARALREGAEERTRTQARVDSLLASLTREAELLGANREQVAAYELALAGASDAEVAMARALGRRLDEQERAALAAEEAARVQREQEEAARRHAEAIAAEADALRDLINPYRPLLASMERATALREAGAISVQEEEQRIGQLREQLHRLGEEGTSDSERLAGAFGGLERAVQGWGRSFADALLDGERNMTGFADAILRELARIALAEATSPLFDAFAAFAKEAVGGISFGGSDLIDRPEFSGVKPGRASGGPVYAGRTYVVGERGPELLTMGATTGHVAAHGAGGGAPSVRVEVINRGTPQQATDTQVRLDPQAMVVSIVTEDIARRGGPISRAMEGAFGLRRGASG